jgi:hypothetical protein
VGGGTKNASKFPTLILPVCWPPTPQVRQLTRWEPALSPPLPGCPFRYFTQNETLDLFRSMGVKTVHLVGDSMNR